MNTDTSISTWQAELAVDCRCTLGEGPQWDANNQRLYWCDILEKQLHWLSPPLEKAATFSLIIRCHWLRPLKRVACC
ncbi:hypothetical protein HORIV_41220 [Vreelandella olivaria]|uniref:SMP-30/Gluconolactonase/LRE-like region domain-containing protein n=1 Tax=Vreelandella olivaria TaxID=390919 RepID=A0ABM7GLZ9_9GAMM|nr:hypothetical protein HORIV_41220 [Halomonas olivaria]